MRSARLKLSAGAWCVAALLAGAAFAQAESNTPIELAGDRPDRLSVGDPDLPAPLSADRAQETLPLGPAPRADRGEGLQAPGAPDDRASGTTLNEVLRVGTALIVVLGLLFVARAGLKRVAGPLAGGGRPSGVVDVLARFPVARGQQLVLLKLSSRVVLLHQSRGAMSTLVEVSDPDEVAALLACVESGRRASQTTFHGLFHRFVNSASDETSFSSKPGEAERRDGRKVVVDLTRRPPRGRREFRKGSMI